MKMGTLHFISIVVNWLYNRCVLNIILFHSQLLILIFSAAKLYKILLYICKVVVIFFFFFEVLNNL